MSNSNQSGHHGSNQRGGSHEQHVQAGQQSHKNDDNNARNAGGGSQSGSSSRGGGHEQPMHGDEQGHKHS